MRRPGLLLAFASVVAACGRTAEQPPADTTAAVTPAPAPVPVSLADFAGRWSVRVMPEVGDSTLVTYELVASADGSGWTQNLPNRPPNAIRIIGMAGDSVMTEVGPFESVLRAGVTVNTTSVLRLRDGRLIAATVARYSGSGGGTDSTVRLRGEGTRLP